MMVYFIRSMRLARDRAGMAAVEFALLLPVFLTLFIGSFEVSDLLLTYLKLQAAAETAADLVAQTDVNTTLADSDFDDISSAVQKVLTPLSTTGLKIAYASITYKTTAHINWHKENNGATAITSITGLPNGVTATTMGTVSSTSTDSVIVVNLTYPYTSAFSGYLNFNATLTEAKYNRPRYVSCVPVTGVSCP